jgi:hypothetical protein
MLDDAIMVLKQVVHLAPKRAVAWLNLGDSFRAALRRATDWQAKLAYSQQTAAAYRSYVARAGKTVAGVDDFLTLNPTNAPASVCDYIGAFYSHGRQDEIFGLPDPVDIAGDGRMVHVYVRYGGSAAIPDILATTEKIDPSDLLGSMTPTEVDFSGGDEERRIWFNHIRVVPFRDKYYVVYELDDGPYSVVKPNAGRLCTFRRKLKPSLDVDRLPGTCQRLLSGPPFEPVLPARGALPPGISSGPVTIAGTVKATLADGTPARFGTFTLVPYGGRACTAKGVALIAEDTLEKSPRAEALDDVEKQVPFYCSSSASSLVRVDAEVMVQTTTGTAYEQKPRPHALFRILKDRIEEMCRVNDGVHYVPQAAAR